MYKDRLNLYAGFTSYFYKNLICFAENNKTSFINVFIFLYNEYFVIL